MAIYKCKRDKDVCESVLNGISYFNTGVNHGISASLVGKICSRYKVRSKLKNGKNKVQPHHPEKWYKMSMDGMSGRDISKTEVFTEETINRHIKRFAPKSIVRPRTDVEKAIANIDRLYKGKNANNESLEKRVRRYAFACLLNVSCFEEITLTAHKFRINRDRAEFLYRKWRSGYVGGSMSEKDLIRLQRKARR